jgi:type VI secretion system secreted protein VgrG
VQTATVVDRTGNTAMPGTSGDGEDIVMDKHGRVRVKFHWDVTPAGQGGTSSCWLRCAQSWAGRQYGFQFVPRVGMEVVVQFIDGDPDQPLITGCVYNGLNPPPYADKPTQSGIKTASSVDLRRYNELRFEDAKDNEQIFVRAQRDYVDEVLNDHKTTVHASQSQLVRKNQSEAVNGNASLAVGGSRNKAVAGPESIKVKGTRTTTVAKKNTEIYEDEHEQTVTAAVTITHNDTRTTTVKKDDVETISEGNKAISVVSGACEVRSAKALTLVQNGEHALQFDNNCHLQTSTDYTVTNGKTQVASGGGELQLTAESAIKLACGSAQIELKSDGSINITGTKISITAGNNSVVADSTGVSVSGVKISSTAVGIHEIQGAMIKIG